MERDQVISEIKSNLKRRSGKSWSVTGGRGTAWGWITIDVPPAKRTAHHVLKAGAADIPENYEEVENDQPNGHITRSDRELLKSLLGLDSIHHQGVSIPASSAYYQEYLDRSAGATPSKIGEPYWD